MLAERPGEEANLIAELAAQTTDRTRLIPLADSRFASAATLDELSRSKDFGVALSALRNPNVSSESIVWVYRNHSYPYYFFSTFAAHPATPAWILTELYAKRAQNTGIPGGSPRIHTHRPRFATISPNGPSPCIRRTAPVPGH